MKLAIAAASAAAIAFVAPVAAQAQTTHTGLYANFGYAHLDARGANLDALQGRLGYRFGDWVGVEGELAAGVGSDDVTVLGTNVDVKLRRQAAIYATGFAPLGPNTDLIARVGYGNTKVRGSVGGVSATGDGDSWNFGLGAQHHFDGLNGVRVDWTRQEFTGSGSGKADVWSIGYSRRF